MSYQDYVDDEEGKNFFQRYRIAIGIGIAALLLVGATVSLLTIYGKVPPPHKPEEIVIHLQPPPPLPPPPPPPPPPPQPPEKKFVEQPKDLKPLVKKDEVKNPDKPPGPPAPAASGPPSEFGLGGSGGGGNGNEGGDGGSRYGPFAAEVQTRVQQALSQNDKTKQARLHVKVRIWINNMGSVTRASLSGSTGDPVLDATLKNQVLTGLNLPEAPPTDMPMPIVMMINEQRPN